MHYCFQFKNGLAPQVCVVRWCAPFGYDCIKIVVFLDAPVIIKTDNFSLAIMRALRSVFGKLYIPHVFVERCGAKNINTVISRKAKVMWEGLLYKVDFEKTPFLRYDF